PRIPDSEVKRYTRLLQSVERKHIVSGCNGVIRLLQNGHVSACFILSSFNPQMFAKLIIQMARKHNPSVLVLAVPVFPIDCCRNSTFLAVTKLKENEQSEAVQALVNWMKDLSLRNGFITEQPKTDGSLKKPEKSLSKEKKSTANVPMTDEEVAKFYIFEPVDNDADKSQTRTRAALGTENFISLSVKDSNVVVSNDNDQQPNEPRTKKFKPFRSTYIPLTVNRVQGNPNRVEHKKKRRTQ
uniref:Uncharacterized protein n=1 Tax=Anopheles christyi TaxID=43041 RepID=A0A182K4K5_9DIPT